jgi:hypothetical protein
MQGLFNEKTEGPKSRDTVPLRLCCPLVPSRVRRFRIKLFSLRSETKRNGIRFAWFSHAQAKTKGPIFRFVSLQFFRFISLLSDIFASFSLQTGIFSYHYKSVCKHYIVVEPEPARSHICLVELEANMWRNAAPEAPAPMAKDPNFMYLYKQRQKAD